jgi:Na+/melibiose symporter-like transporter
MKKKILYILIFLVVSVISISLPIFILKSVQENSKEILKTREKTKENLDLFEEILKYKKTIKERQREIEQIKFKFSFAFRSIFRRESKRIKC